VGVGAISRTDRTTDGGVEIGTGTLGLDLGRVHRMCEVIDRDIGKRMVNIPQPLTFDSPRIHHRRTHVGISSRYGLPLCNNATSHRCHKK
jgi:hypothetical protein